MPRSIAVLMSRSASDALTCGSARCQPPNPIAETRSPVLPRMRVGIAAMSCVSSWLDDVRSGPAFSTPGRRGLADQLLERAAERGLGFVAHGLGGAHDP